MFGILGTDKAFNGKEALDKVIANQNNSECLAETHHQQYTAVFLDFNMPLINGAETASKIREMQRTGEISKKIRLVLFTGAEIFNEDYDKNLFDYFMSKPLDKKLLLKICKQLKLN